MDKSDNKSFKNEMPSDDICTEIFVTLVWKKKMRFNELKRTLKKFGRSISNPTLKMHLNHLSEKGLVIRKEEGVQNVSYSLNEEKVPDIPKSDSYDNLVNQINRIEKLEDVKWINIDELIDSQLDNLIKNLLAELRILITYDLRLEKDESYEDFRRFVGDFVYRVIEKSLVDECRKSQVYKETLFKKIDERLNKIGG